MTGLAVYFRLVYLADEATLEIVFDSAASLSWRYWWPTSLACRAL